MARQFLTPINLNKNELQNARVQNLNAAPSNPVSGQIYYDTVTSILYFWNNVEWISTSGSLEVIQDAIGAYVSGGTGLTATYNDETGFTTIDLDNTTVTAASYGAADKVATFTVDAQGRLTAAGETSIQITTSQVTDLEEFIDDTVGDSVSGLVKEGEGIDVVYDDTAGTLTISAEDATDTNKGVASFDSTDFSVTSGNVKLNVERVEDIVSGLVVGGTGIDATYNDGAGTLSIDIDSTVVTKDDQQTLTNKILSTNVDLGANLDAASYKIVNLATPTDAGDAANKGYVDEVAQGLVARPSVIAATTEALDATYDNGISGAGSTLTANSNGAFPLIDGAAVTTLSGQRGVLVKNQTNKAHNGRYNLTTQGDDDTPWVLTRCGLCDSAKEIPGSYVFVTGGTLNKNTGWVFTVANTATFVVGTDAIDVYQFSGAGTYTAGSGLTLTGTEFSVDVTPSSGSASLTNTGGAVEVKTDTNRGLSVDTNGLGINAGTGLTFATGALTFDTSYGVRKLSYSVGNDTATQFTLNHSLGTRDVSVHVYENNSPFGQVEVDVEHTDQNNTLVRFAIAPSTDSYRVVIVG
jgi:hypothetical protein